MEKREIIKMNELEGSNWWYVARRELILSMVPGGTKKVFEIGAGCGRTLQELREKGYRVQGLDIERTATKFSKSKGLDVVNSSLEKYSFKSRYDVFLALDVIEHIEDDSQALSKIRSAISPRGVCIITVPAFMFLFGPHDELNHHFRRYTISELKSKVIAAGFEVEKITYWNFILFMPAMIIKVAKKIMHSKEPLAAQSDLEPTDPIVNLLFLSMLRAENFLIRLGLPMPLGTSVVCIARPGKLVVENPLGRK